MCLKSEVPRSRLVQMTDDQMASKKLCFVVLEESVTVDDVAGGAE